MSKPADFFWSDQHDVVSVGCYYKGDRWTLSFSLTGIPGTVIYRNCHHRYGPGDPGYVPTRFYTPKAAKVVYDALCAEAPRCLHEAQQHRIARVHAYRRAARRAAAKAGA